MTSYSDTEATRDLGTGTGPVVREVPDPGYDDRPRAAAAGRDDRSIADLLRELRDESSTLLRQEVALAKTELSEKANVYTKNAGYVIGGGVAAALGGLLLLHFLAQLVGFVFDLFLPYSIGLPLGYLIVGSILALVGYSLYKKGIDAVKRESPVPHKTVDSLKQDKEWVKNKVTT